MKVAIVGNSLPTRKQAPFDDPEFEIWGTGIIFYKFPKIDRWFEMHFTRAEEIQLERYRNWLTTQTRIPVYMQDWYKEIPAGIRYPKEEIVKEFGTFFTCSISWMLALAIQEGFREIHLYGCHEEDGPYQEQRPSISYFLGIITGKGIKSYLPSESKLLKTDSLYGYNERIEYEIN